jgi:2',3'-cyclic-nucleotide 2'-phosphodiesterase (5'-nucleotidase family)
MSRPCQLQLIPYTRNRYLIQGDATKEPVDAIVPAEGVILPEARRRQRPFRLKIFHLNDLHGNVVRLTRFGDKPVFSRMMWRVEEARRRWSRKENAAVLFLSAGDDMAGSVFDELLSMHNPLHAGYYLYSVADVDAGVIGNHDLDMGTAQLARAIKQDAGFPLLAANLVHDPPFANPAALFVLKGVRVGLIGLATPAQIKCSQDSIQVVDPVQTVHNLLPAMRPLCDVLIITSHLGYSLETPAAEVQGAGDVELARSLPAGAVDLIIGGHTHLALNYGGLEAVNIANGIPIVQAGALGQYLGEVTLTVTSPSPDPASGPTPQKPAVAVTDARLTSTDDLPLDNLFERNFIRPLVHALAPVFNQDLGLVERHPDVTTEAIHNDFNAGESALANFISDGIVTRCRHHGLAVHMAMIDRSVVRYGLPSGDRLIFRDWFNLMPSVDTIRLCRITGQQLLELIQDNAYRLARPDQPNTDSGFLHFSRLLRYTIWPGRRRRDARVVQVTVDGRPLDECLDQTFTLACHSFIRGSAWNWEESCAETTLPLINIRHWNYQDTGFFLRDELLALIRQYGGVTAAGGVQRDGRLHCAEQRPSFIDSSPLAAFAP